MQQLLGDLGENETSSQDQLGQLVQQHLAEAAQLCDSSKAAVEHALDSSVKS